MMIDKVWPANISIFRYIIQINGVREMPNWLSIESNGMLRSTLIRVRVCVWSLSSEIYMKMCVKFNIGIEMVNIAFGLLSIALMSMELKQNVSPAFSKYVNSCKHLLCIGSLCTIDSCSAKK